MLAFLSRVMSCGPEGQKALADPDDDVKAITVKMEPQPSVAPPVKAVIVPPTPSQEVAAPKAPSPKPPTSARPQPPTSARPEPPASARPAPTAPKPAAKPAPLPPMTTKMFVWHAQWKPQEPFVSYGDYSASATVAAAMAQKLIEAACAAKAAGPRSEYMAYWVPATAADSALSEAEFRASLSLPEGKRCALERAARQAQAVMAVKAAAVKKQQLMDKRLKKSPSKAGSFMSPGRSPMKSPVAGSPFAR